MIVPTKENPLWVDEPKPVDKKSNETNVSTQTPLDGNPTSSKKSKPAEPKAVEPKSALVEYNVNDKQELVKAENPRFTKPLTNEENATIIANKPKSDGDKILIRIIPTINNEI